MLISSACTEVTDEHPRLTAVLVLHWCNLGDQNHEVGIKKEGAASTSSLQKSFLHLEREKGSLCSVESSEKLHQTRKGCQM